MKTKFVFMILVLFLGSCASFKVKKQSGLNAVNPQKGVNLILPETEIILDIPLVTTKYVRGACFDSCKSNPLILGRINKPVVDSLCLNNREIFIRHNMDEIKISTRAVPDSNKIYFLRTKELSWWNDRGLSLSFNENGFVNTAETSFENHIPEIAIGTISTLTSVATTFAGFAKDDGKDTKTPCDKIKESLENLRKLRLEMLTNKNYGGSDNEKVLDQKLLEIDKIELALLSELLFYTSKKTDVIRVKLVLNVGMQTAQTLLFKVDGNQITFNNAVFSNISILNNPGGIACGFAPLPRGAVDSAYYFLDFYKQGSLRINPASASPKRHGLPYNIPVNYQAVIMKNGEENASTEVKIAQWGTLGFLSRSASLMNIEYDPQTGALQKMKLEQKATLSADDIKSMGESLNGAAGAFKKPTPDELAELQHEQSILESKVAIQKLRKELTEE